VHYSDWKVLPTTVYCLLVIEESEEERLRSSSSSSLPVHYTSKQAPNTQDRNLEMTLQFIGKNGTEFWETGKCSASTGSLKSVRVFTVLLLLNPEPTLNKSQNCSRTAHSDLVRLYRPSKNLSQPRLFFPEQRSIRYGGPL
jgi:hypothetical protein